VGNKAPSRVVNLDAVTLWIVAGGVAHIMKGGEPLTALCGRDQWHKAAVVALDNPARVCSSCRESFKLFPDRRPRLADVQPVRRRQLALPGWFEEELS
jgi:hypothetical protein